MENSLGKKIALLRKTKGFTQDELAERLGVSAQAVSKWENNIACPDIMLLAPIAELFHVTTDELLSANTSKSVKYISPSDQLNFNELTLKVIIDSNEGDKVRINLPMQLVKIGLEIGLKLPQVAQNEKLENIDLTQIVALVESGAIGKLVEIESTTGDNVYIVVE